jgi:hypothetical protein
MVASDFRAGVEFQQKVQLLQELEGLAFHLEAATLLARFGPCLDLGTGLVVTRLEKLRGRCRQLQKFAAKLLFQDKAEELIDYVGTVASGLIGELTDCPTDSPPDSPMHESSTEAVSELRLHCDSLLADVRSARTDERPSDAAAPSNTSRIDDV